MFHFENDTNDFNVYATTLCSAAFQCCQGYTVTSHGHAPQIRWRQLTSSGHLHTMKSFSPTPATCSGMLHSCENKLIYEEKYKYFWQEKANRRTLIKVRVFSDHPMHNAGRFSKAAESWTPKGATPKCSEQNTSIAMLVNI